MHGLRFTRRISQRFSGIVSDYNTHTKTRKADPHGRPARLSDVFTVMRRCAMGAEAALEPIPLPGIILHINVIFKCLRTPAAAKVRYEYSHLNDFPKLRVNYFRDILKLRQCSSSGTQYCLRVPV